LKAGESADISVSVNPELLGGMIVSVGDKYTEMKSIDMSVLTKVKKYTEMLHRSS
jgi:F0F1-type ATP synthase delta subunit